MLRFGVNGGVDRRANVPHKVQRDFECVLVKGYGVGGGALVTTDGAMLALAAPIVLTSSRDCMTIGMAPRYPPFHSAIVLLKSMAAIRI